MNCHLETVTSCVSLLTYACTRHNACTSVAEGKHTKKHCGLKIVIVEQLFPFQLLLSLGIYTIGSQQVCVTYCCLSHDVILYNYNKISYEIMFRACVWVFMSPLPMRNHKTCFEVQHGIKTCSCGVCIWLQEETVSLI